MQLPAMPSVADLARLYRQSAAQQLGQNFLFDLNVTDKIAHAISNVKGAVVVEVGPGPGPLTRSLLQAGAGHVVAVEKDKRFLPNLQMVAEAVPGRLTVVCEDALRWDPTPTVAPLLHASPGAKLRLVGNLPFNVATPLLLQWLRGTQERTGLWALGDVELTLMFQKEVAERILAPPSTKQRSRLSVMVQRLYKPADCFIVKGSAFVPPPKVDGKVVRLQPLSPSDLVPFDVAETVCRALFAERRKMVRNTLGLLYPGLAREEQQQYVSKVLGLAQVDGSQRAEDLHANQVEALAHAHMQTPPP